VTALEVAGLRVDLSPGGEEIVSGVSFTVDRGEVVGLVGESGSGKTTVALAVLGHARRGTRIAGGSVRVAGEEILTRSPTQLRAARGKIVSYVPQDPAASLNPALRIETQLTELIAAHQRDTDATQARARVCQVLEEVKLPTGGEFLRRYPHELSGGQQQRVCIAMAFLLRPQAIVLDEPTTGLDVTTQAHVLETVRDLCANHDVGAVYVSHDLAAVGSLAGRVLVMYAGRLIEAGPTDRLFVRPGHPYTEKLIAAIPDIAGRRELEAIPGNVPAPGRRPSGCVFAPRCPAVLPSCREAEPALVSLEADHDAACFRALERERRAVRVTLVDGEQSTAGSGALLTVSHVDAFHGSNQVLHDVSLELHPRECLALVGESGSGKTTLARAIMGLHASWTGEIRFQDAVLRGRARDRSTDVRRSLQYIFQSPYNSLNPRHTVGQIVRVPIEHFFGFRSREAVERAKTALERVALPPGVDAAYPDELSGGERQRVAIARALACEPEVLVCDEITSALDVSVQAAIVRLLEELRQRERLAILFVTHNLALVRTIADRVLVLREGRVVETGAASEVIGSPAHAYTRELIADTPSLVGLVEQSPVLGAAAGAGDE
jgi:peptide/nickel transport system ATP-binding protein